MKMRILSLLTALLALSTLQAQIFSTKGTDFWFGFMENYNSPTLRVYISSDVATSGTVSIPGQTFSQNFTVAANATTVITVPNNQAHITTSQVIENKAVRVVANDPVTVYALNYEAYSSDAAIVLPVNTLGVEYYMATAQPAVSSGSPMPSEILIVGTQNGTAIQITPTVATLAGNAAGVPFNITLNQGQVYQIKSSGDLSGTRIISTGACQKFAVFTGAKCTNVGGCNYCDHLFEQMYPTATWGYNYATSPYLTRNADVFKIVASIAGTQVSINGGAPINLNAGQVHTQNLTPASYISSNNPIMVVQYSRGGDCDGANADPFAIVLSPVEQTLNNITFNAFTSTVISNYYVNIVSPTASIGSVTLDGVNMAGFFAPIASNPAYSHCRRNITQGNHTIVAPGGVNAYVYGYGSYESYGYVAGASLDNLGLTFDMDAQGSNYAFSTIPTAQICTNSSVTFNGQAGQFTVLNWNWDFGDGTTATGQNVSHTYLNPGTYTVTMSADINNLCAVETLTFTQTININNHPPLTTITNSPVTICPGDNVNLLVTTSQPGANFLWSTGATTNNITVSPPNDQTYSVTTSWYGCTQTDFVDVNVNIPDGGPSCNVIYVNTTGGGDGTQASPTDLLTALSLAACNGAHIKMATGTYNINNPITTFGSYTTLEGGFDPTTWIKTSAPGATTINRTATNLEGPANAPRIVAIQGNGIHDFRLQDLTITTANPPIAPSGYGVSTYGLHLTGAYNYDLVRCQILPGNASNGDGDNNPATFNSTWDGANGGNGGNGVTGQAGQCTCNLSTDNGGNGGAGGTAGGAGANATPIGGSATAGFAGGAGGRGRDDNQSGNGDNGNVGLGGAGCGGTAGTGGPSDSNNADTPYGGFGGVGGAGSPGTPGTTNPSSFAGGFFIPGQGTNGTPGTGGCGGGGGGGAGRDTGGCDAAGGGGSGGGGGGGGGGAGRGGFGGGSSFALYLFNNGTNGNVIDCNVNGGTAGNGGTGGTGGNGGNGGLSFLGNGCSDGDANRGGRGGDGGAGGAGGAGGNGPNGQSHSIYFDGIVTPLVTNVSTFNLAAQPVINVSNVSCTNVNAVFSAGLSAGWDSGSGSTPQTFTGAAHTTQYTTTGIKDVQFNSNAYTGFVTILLNGTGVTPSIATTAVPYGATPDYHVCVGGTADFTAAPAGLNYTYHWNFGGAATPNLVSTTNTNLNGVVFNTPGTYTITLQVETPCCGIGTTTATINLIVDPIPSPTIVASTTSFCYGESVDLTASGGTQYVWSDGTTTATNTVTPFVSTTYTVNVTNFECVGTTDITLAPNIIDVYISGNDQICNGDNTDLTANSDPSATFQWSGGSTATTDIINVSPTTNTMYYVTATLNGCEAMDSLQVQVVQTIATVSASNVLVCQGDEVMLTVEGGDYFNWSHGDTGDTVYVYPTVPTTFEVLVLWDSIGTISCNTQQLLQIFVDLHPTPSITSVSNDTTVCTNAQITLSAAGNGISLLWSTGETTATINPTILGDTTFTVNAVSDLGCFSFDQDIVISTITGITDVTLNATNATCFGFMDGSITSTVTGGISPYTYLWSNGAITPDLTGVGAGVYSLIVTADNGCTLTASGAQGEVTEFPDVIASITPDQTIVCQGEPVVLTINGGTTYLWDTGETTPSITVNPTVQTIYSVVVVYDSLGVSCSPSNLTQITVDVHPTPSMNTVSNDTLVCTFATIGLTANGTGVGYIWSTGETRPSISPTILGDTIFIVNAISDLGCLSFNDTIYITTIEGISDVQLLVTDATCFGFADGSIAATVVSGVAPYTYLWSNGETTSSISNLTAGDYTVVVTANNGCEYTNMASPASISSFPDIAAGFTLDPETGLPPLAVEFTNQTINGISYVWNFGDGGSSTDEHPTHTYTTGGSIDIYMIATDVNGCTDTAYYAITLVGESSIIIPNIFTPNNDGSNDLLRITAQYIETFSMTIFNRWGQVMAQIDWLGGGWDGATMAGVPASEGVYYYLVNAVGFDGKIHEINGHFTLIR